MTKFREKKGDSVESPSDFQSEGIKSTDYHHISGNGLRSCAPARAQACERPKIVLNVLVACEESQAECLAFRELGHNAYSCDIQPCRRNGHPEWHIMGDVTPMLHGETAFVTMDGCQHDVHCWDLIICHPPCTYLTKLSSVQLHKNADGIIVFGGRVLHVNHDRLCKMAKAREFFMECLNANSKYVAVENPIPMRLAQLPKCSTYVCPSWFGVKYTKKTLYWLKGLPPIMAGTQYPNPKSFVNASRGKYRSRTFPQLAEAIAKQWSEFIISEKESSLINPK